MKQTRNSLFVVAASLLLSLPGASALAAPTLHFVGVYDTEDQSIGATVKIDVDNWNSRLADIGDALGSKMEVVNQTIKAPAAWGSAEVRKACADLAVGADDAVIFYYSGHGFYTEAMQLKWPAMALMKQPNGQPDSVKLSEVYKTLKAKNPRLLLVLGDCCNSLASDKYTPKPAPRGDMASGYRALFLQAKGGWISSGCEQGQYKYSGCNRDKGGYYTFALLEEMDHAVNGNAPTWDAIFAGTKALMPSINPRQVPQSEFNPSDTLND